MVSIETGGLATSSTGIRRWETAQGPVHHLLDPRTGRPAVSPWTQVSVAADSCVDANVASTAAIVLGSSAPAWLERRGLPARLERAGGSIVFTAGWPIDGAAAA